VQTHRVRLGQLEQGNAVRGHAGEVEAVPCRGMEAVTSRRFPAPWRADKIGARLFVVAEWNHPTVCAARILEYVASPAYREPVSLLHGTKTVNPELIRTSLRKRPWAPEVGMGCDDEDTAMLFMALGKAVGAIWSNLPKDVQHQLFEKAVASPFFCMRDISAPLMELKRAPCRSPTVSGGSLRKDAGEVQSGLLPIRR
jgi:hypothetical protein